MDALIDEVLETLMHSAIWRSTSYLSFTTLIIVAIVAFCILAYRRSNRSHSRSTKSRTGLKYRRKYRND